MTRNLTRAEIAIVERLLDLSSMPLDGQLDDLQAQDMSDGGMGSIRFIHGQGEAARLGKNLTVAWGTDLDGVALSLTLNLDQFGRLFELDIWKMDFSALQALPDATTLALDLSEVRKADG